MEVYATKQEENCRAERGVGGGVQQNNLESCRAIVYIGRVLIPQYIIFTLFLIPSSSVNLYSRLFFYGKGPDWGLWGPWGPTPHTTSSWGPRGPWGPTPFTRGPELFSLEGGPVRDVRGVLDPQKATGFWH